MPNPSPKISLRLPDEMRAALEKKAEEKGIASLGHYIRQVLARHLKQPAPDMPEGRPKKNLD